MDRCAVFVDAGYLYAEGGKLCCGSAKRDRVHLSPSDARDFLAARASGVPVLRIYWYDGARDGIPTTEQQTIAALSNVKLRLGRLNLRRQQKGVDALIYRDLMTLARERAISDAYLIAGDEDLREGVRTAQDMGVRVTLIGIEPRKGTRNQPRELASEADEVVKLSRP
ncbi:MAG: NYN domain-containing protein [Acidimicrobiaceae bacterium]|nr:NYN domain-containing protein [Acidimicrobiaceae bacterium]